MNDIDRLTLIRILTEQEPAVGTVRRMVDKLFPEPVPFNSYAGMELSPAEEQVVSDAFFKVVRMYRQRESSSLARATTALTEHIAGIGWIKEKS